MRRNFHEPLAESALKPPSERATGLMFAALALLAAAVWRQTPAALWTGMAGGVFLIAMSLWAPRRLGPLNMAWFRLGQALHRIVNPLVMLVVFVLVFVPGGLLMRLFNDPLRSKRDRVASTYWISREGEDARASMTKQF